MDLEITNITQTHGFPAYTESRQGYFVFGYKGSDETVYTDSSSLITYEDLKKRITIWMLRQTNHNKPLAFEITKSGTVEETVILNPDNPLGVAILTLIQMTTSDEPQSSFEEGCHGSTPISPPS